MTADDGKFGGPTDIARLLVPEHIDLTEDGEGIVWSWGDAKAQHPDRNMLDSFIALADLPDTRLPARVLSFSARYGPLGVCKHGFPASHNRRVVDPEPRVLVGLLRSGELSEWPGFDMAELNTQAERCEPLTRGEAEYWEPLAFWRYYARQARAILVMAADIQQEERFTQEEIDPYRRQLDLIDNARELLGVAQEKDMQRAWDRYAVQRFVTRWLDLGGVSLWFDWSGEGQAALRVQPGGLFGALAHQIAVAAAQGTGIAFCSNCKQPYIPKRIPALSRRTYCPSCGPAAARRDASRDYRARKRAAPV